MVQLLSFQSWSSSCHAPTKQPPIDDVFRHFFTHRPSFPLRIICSFGHGMAAAPAENKLYPTQIPSSLSPNRGCSSSSSKADTTQYPVPCSLPPPPANRLPSITHTANHRLSGVQKSTRSLRPRPAKAIENKQYAALRGVADLFILHEDTPSVHPEARAIEASHAACNEVLRRNPPSHS